MKSVRHCHWHTSVHIHGEKSLLARTAHLSTDLECAAALRVNAGTFVIEKARWEIYRGPGGPLSVDIGGLAGVEAYLGSGSGLRQAVLKDFGEKALSLVSEAVRGIIQAETFLYRERGFPDAKSYDEYWEKMYVNTCRYYSNLGRILRRWEDHVSGQNRFNNLFNRFKSVSVAGNNDIYRACASLSDSFHEVGLDLTLEKKTGTVTSVHCSLLRAPDPVCTESVDFVKNLLGRELATMSKKEIAAALAGTQGCVHVIDICNDVAAVSRDLL